MVTVDADPAVVTTNLPAGFDDQPVASFIHAPLEKFHPIRCRKTERCCSGRRWGPMESDPLPLQLLQRTEPAQGSGSLCVIDFMTAMEGPDSNSLKARSLD